MLDDSGAPRRGVLDVVGEWSQEDEVLANVTRTSDEEQQRRLLRNYLSGLPNTTMALHRWVADTKLVVDCMGREPATSLPGRLAARVTFAAGEPSVIQWAGSPPANSAWKIAGALPV